MFKMMFVLLSLVFMVAACNKNNSKADRVKKNPALPGAPAGDQKPAETKPTETDPQSTDGRKGDEGNKGDTSKPGGTVNPPPSSTGGTKPSATTPSTGSTTTAPTAGSTTTTTTTAATTTDAEEAQALQTAPAQPVQKIDNVKITGFPSMGYNLVEMTTEKGMNALTISALLNADSQQSRQARLYCYDANVIKETSRENVPELFIFPQSELLMEIKKAGTAADEISVGPREENPNIKFLLATCQGAKDGYTQATKDYDYVKLKADTYHLEYLRTDPAKERDAEMAQISVLCSRDNISAKMDQKTDEAKKIVKNRLTLSSGSKIMVARPMNYYVDKKGTKFKDAHKNLKAFSIIECE